jgi:hypothetical protein
MPGIASTEVASAALDLIEETRKRSPAAQQASELSANRDD